MTLKQTLLFPFLSKVPSHPKVKGKPGRPSLFLTTLELEEALQYYFTVDPKEKKRLLDKFGKRRLTHAKQIYKLDLGKRGKIYRRTCNFHGRAYHDLFLAWQQGWRANSLFGSERLLSKFSF